MRTFSVYRRREACNIIRARDGRYWSNMIHAVTKQVVEDIPMDILCLHVLPV